jgi:uncharacterized protein (TIGR02271 family)
VPLIEEEVRVLKQSVLTGKVRIRTFVETIEEQARAVLAGEQVEVTRVPVDRVIDEAPSVRTEHGVTIVPICEEVLFIEKRLVLKEELHIRRRATSETVEVPVMLRKQRATVDRLEDGDHATSNEDIDS